MPPKTEVFIKIVIANTNKIAVHETRAIKNPQIESPSPRTEASFVQPIAFAMPEERLNASLFSKR